MKFTLGRNVYDFNTILRIMKTKYEADFFDFSLDYPEIAKRIDEDIWRQVIPFMYEDFMQIKNTAKAEFLFQFTELHLKLFLSDEHSILLAEDSAVFNQKQWDEEGNLIYEGPHTEHIQLRAVETARLVTMQLDENVSPYTYAVIVHCTTAKKPAVLIVGSGSSVPKSITKKKYDPFEYLAGLTFCPYTNPVAMYRQGEQFFFELGPDSKRVPPYPLTKDMYFKLMAAQS